MASRIGYPEKWAELASAVPEEGIDGLLECLRVVPARAKAARALFYAAKAPLAGGTGGELVESRGGVTVRRRVLFGVVRLRLALRWMSVVVVVVVCW